MQIARLLAELMAPILTVVAFQAFTRQDGRFLFTRWAPPLPPLSDTCQVIHHAGHVDYVVNGRLIHPIHSSRAAGESGTFEDHGSIRALDDEFVSFYETLDVLSENADKALESFCDLCEDF